MKAYATEDIRNVVLMGHGSVGKTTLGEAALFVSGAITRFGTIEDQNTVSDYDDDEHKRKFSLNLAILPVEWEGRKINLIDTPGYADFVSEVICGAQAADMALVVVDAVSGPEVGTDRAWQIAERLKLPRMIVVNRMDRENANFEHVLAACSRRWGPKVTPLQLPIGAHDTFEGVVDLLHMQGLRRRARPRRRDDPRRPPGAGRSAPHPAHRGDRRDRRGSDDEVLRRRGADRGRTPQGAPRRARPWAHHPRGLRLRGPPDRRAPAAAQHRLQRPFAARARPVSTPATARSSRPTLPARRWRWSSRQPPTRTSAGSPTSA